jgi:hypothetical protein
MAAVAIATEKIKHCAFFSLSLLTRRKKLQIKQGWVRRNSLDFTLFFTEIWLQIS